MVATLTSLGLVLNTTASSAHLKALVGVDERTAAASRLDTGIGLLTSALWLPWHLRRP